MGNASDDFDRDMYKTFGKDKASWEKYKAMNQRRGAYRKIEAKRYRYGRRRYYGHHKKKSIFGLF